MVMLHEFLFSSSEKMEDCLAKKMEITVSEAEKRTGRNAMNIQETYTAYLIETRWVMRAHSQSMWRCHSKQILPPSTPKNIQVQLMRGFSWFVICYAVINLPWRIFSCENLASDLQFGTNAGVV